MMIKMMPENKTTTIRTMLEIKMIMIKMILEMEIKMTMVKTMPEIKMIISRRCQRRLI